MHGCVFLKIDVRASPFLTLCEFISFMYQNKADILAFELHVLVNVVVYIPADTQQTQLEDARRRHMVLHCPVVVPAAADG